MSVLIKKGIVKSIFISAILLKFSTYSQADIAVIVHPDSPIETLSDLELKRIFLGRLGRWPNAKEDIEVIDILSDNPLYEQFYTEIINFKINKLKRYRAAFLFSGKGALPKVLTDQSAVIKAILDDPYKIGYVETENLQGNERVVFTWPGS